MESERASLVPALDSGSEWEVMQLETVSKLAFMGSGWISKVSWAVMGTVA